MIENLKDLEKLLKLCRKQGVIEINLGAIAFKLGDLPQSSAQASQVSEEDVQDPLDPWSQYPVGDLDPETLANYNAGPIS